MIRYCFFAVFIVALCSLTVAQIPRQISYQGYITNATGQPLTGSHSLVVKIYDAANNTLFTEQYSNITVTNGVFTVLLGASLPISLDFSRQYFVGVSVDGGAELLPRTPMTAAPYALRSEVANALSSSANLVTSVNTISGAVKITGGGATTVTRSNDTILISSSGGGSGSGIQGVQNSDGSLSIANPNGPVATINLQSVPLETISAGGAAENQFMRYAGTVWVPSTLTDYLNIQTTPRLVGTGSTANKLDLAQQGAESGQVLKWNGAAWTPAADLTSSFALPHSSSVSSASTLFSLTNSGTGKVAEFISQGTGNTTNVLLVTTGGSGNALGVQSTGNAGAATLSTTASPNAVVTATAGANSTGGVLSAINNGTGLTGAIRNANASNTANVLEVSTTGTGKAGVFLINHNTNSNPALDVSTTGTGHGITVSTAGVNSSALFASHGTTGTAVTGSSQDGTGVFGVSISGVGVRGVHSTAIGTAPGVEGKTSSAVAGANPFGGASGVYGEVTPNNPGAWSAGVRGYNKGTGANGIGTEGLHDGSGYGVYGETVGAGTGVYGKANAQGFGGYFEVPAGGAGWGLVASTAAKPGGGNFAVFSDRSLKRDIRPFYDGLNIIERIDPVWYTYNGRGGLPNGEQFVGIIAQEMQPLMPYAVKESQGMTTASQEKYLSFDPSALTYIQINAIKELVAKLEAMQLRIEALEALLREQGVDPVVAK